MGLLSWLFGCGAKQERIDSSPITIDLVQFRCNSTALGERPEPGDFFYGRFNAEGVFSDASQGLELGVSDGRLDYIFVTVGRFPGRFAAAGKELSIGAATVETDCLQQFGEPCWRGPEAAMPLPAPGRHAKAGRCSPRGCSKAFIIRLPLALPGSVARERDGEVLRQANDSRGKQPLDRPSIAGIPCLSPSG